MYRAAVGVPPRRGLSRAISTKTISAIVSGIIASAITPCQPTAGLAARRGATRLVMTVPLLPAAAMPIASPCFSGGYQRLASGSATAKEAPATPRSAPIAIRSFRPSPARQPKNSGP